MIWLQKLRNQRFYIILRQPAANIIDDNAQLHVLFHRPDNFQGVTEIVSDGLQKPSRVNIELKKTFKVLWAQQNTFDLRPEDLSTKGLESSMANDAKKQPIKFLFDQYQKS